MNRLVLNIILISLASSVFSQTEKQVATDTLIVVKSYQPTLIRATKISDYPSVIDTQKIDLDFNYQFISKQIETYYTPDTIKAAKIKGEPLIKLYRGYAILGVGNNSTPWGEMFYNGLRSRNKSWGVHLKHFSSNGVKDIDNSDFRRNQFNLYGKKFAKKVVMDAGIHYDLHKMNYYGTYVNPAEFAAIDDIKTSQQYNTLGANFGISNLATDSAALNFKLGLAFNNHQDDYDAKENNLVISSEFRTRLDNGLLGTLILDIDNNKYESKLLDSSITASTTIVKIYPKLNAGNEKWQLTGGPAFFLETGDESNFVIRAIAEFKINLIEEILIPYAGVSGGIKRNSYRSFTNDNPFVNTTLELANSDDQINIYGGIRGSFSSKISFNASLGSRQVKSEPFYIKTYYTDSTFERSFNVIYDNMNVTTIRGELSYANREKLKVFLLGEFYVYEVDRIDEAWHKPEYRITLAGRYDLRNKILLNVDFFLIGSQKAPYLFNEGTSFQPVILQRTKTLDGMFDANLGLEYRYTKKVSAFLNFNNIASIQYEKWQDYYTQRFNVMGGLKFSF